MGTPFKMKGSPMQRNFGVGSPLRKDNVVSKTSPGPGYKKIKGTNTWEHTETKENKNKEQESEDTIAENAGWTTVHGRRYLKDEKGRIDPSFSTPR
jgi:hypothetical protein|tara:strand:- start:48 stop:335 length:288 start_codon:yes stop_codon:yes gene_type:complete